MFLLVFDNTEFYINLKARIYFLGYKIESVYKAAAASQPSSGWRLEQKYISYLCL